MAETNEQKPTDTAPAKSEETEIVLRYLRMKRDECLNVLIVMRRGKIPKTDKFRVAAQIAFDSFGVAITTLESRSTHTLVSNELWAEIKRVLGEYGREGNWNRPIGYILDHKFAFGYYSEDGHVLDGFLPAQLVLAKLEGEKNATNG